MALIYLGYVGSPVIVSINVNIFFRVIGSKLFTDIWYVKQYVLLFLRYYEWEKLRGLNKK